MEEITETHVNIISEDTIIEGQVTFSHVTRFHGTLKGDVKAADGSQVILGETAVVEGNVDADSLIVDGFVRGDIQAKTKVVISGTGRVIGDIESPSLEVDFGAYFEGQCAMHGNSKERNEPVSKQLEPEPA